MLWLSEIWKNSAYKRSRKDSVLYAGGFKRKKIQLEMKYAKLFQGMKHNL